MDIRSIATMLFILCAALLGASSAEASALPEPFQTWQLEAKVPVPQDVTIVFDLPDDQRTSSDPQNHLIHWYADPTVVERWDRSRPTFFHELGHLYDWSNLGLRKRQALTHLFPGWWPAEGSWTEQFAMLYSYCALGAYPYPGWDGYGYAPPFWKNRLGCKLLRH